MQTNMIKLLKKIWKFILVAIFGGVVLASVLPPVVPDIAIEKMQEKYNNASEIRVKYQLEGASLRISNNKVKDRLDVLIGGKNEFEPKMRIERWDNEVSFSIKLIENENGKPTLKFDKDKIVWEKGNIKVEYFSTEDSYKFVWYLDKKPVSNVVQFELESSGVDFYYQPELTQEEIDDGAFRPENVIDSYAVYHNGDFTNWVGGVEYKIGKVGHMLRPRLKDSNGWEVWGGLNIENGLYKVTIPTDFYEDAVYPIRSNDTFGLTTVGGTNTNASEIRGSVATVSFDGDITKFSVYSFDDSGTTDMAVAIYTNETSFLDNVLLAESSTDININSATPQWWDNPNISYTVTASTNYVLTFWYKNTARLYYDTGTTSWEQFNGVTQFYDPWSNAPGEGTFNGVISIYATYTLLIPQVTTNTVDEIQDTQADGNGNVINIGATNITERGFVWDTASKADPGDVAPGSSGYANVVNESGTYGTGVFSVTMTGLTEHVTYYVRAYVKNDDNPVEYGYGDEVTFEAGRIREVDTTDADFGDGTHTNTVAISNNVELACVGPPEGFEGSFLPVGWTTGGNANWFKSSAQAYTGTYSAEGGNIGDNQTTWIDRDYTFSGDGELKFWWKVSSEGGWDYLVYCEDIDGTCSRTTYTLRISGSTSWAQITRNISSGSHSFRWMFAKDSSASGGSDTGWIDDIDFGEVEGCQSSGNYVSDNLETNELNSVDTGHISWNATLNGQTLVVATNVSYNNGGAWQGWNNISSSGDVIPDISGISVPADGLVKYRLTLSGNGTSTPQVHDVTVDREFEEAVEGRRRLIIIQ